MVPRLAPMLLLATVPSAALASEPCDCFSGRWTALMAPLDGSTLTVPSNLAWLASDISGPGATALVFRQKTPRPSEVADRVAVVARTSDLGGLMMLSPERPLTQGETYLLEDPARSTVLEVKVGGPDTTPPNVDVTFQPWALGGACPAHVSAGLMSGPDQDDLTPSENLVYLVEIESDTSKRLLAMAGRGALLFGREEDAPTHCLISYPEAEVNKTFVARVRAVDLAGNVSDTSAARAFEFGEWGGDGFLGCSTTSATGVRGWAAALLLLMAAQRRRRGAVAR